VEEFDASEIKLDLEPTFVQSQLPCRRESLHAFVRFDEAPAFSFFVHVFLQLFGAVACVSNNDAVDILVDLSEGIAVIAVCARERETENSAVIVPRHGHFEAEIEAFSGVSP